MGSDDIAVQILRDIRDEIRGVREEVHATNVRVDATNVRLDAHIEATRDGLQSLREDLGRKIVESEVRTATAIHELAGTMHDVRDLLRDRLDLRDRVDRCERDIAELKQRVVP